MATDAYEEEKLAKQLLEKENQAQQALITYRTTHERNIIETLQALNQSHHRVKNAFAAAIARNPK